MKTLIIKNEQGNTEQVYKLDCDDDKEINLIRYYHYESLKKENEKLRELDCFMDNITAYKLGKIVREVGDIRKDIGDNIDRGLVLVRVLKDNNFIITLGGGE